MDADLLHKKYKMFGDKLLRVLYIRFRRTACKGLGAVWYSAVGFYSALCAAVCDDWLARWQRGRYSTARAAIKLLTRELLTMRGAQSLKNRPTARVEPVTNSAGRP